MDKTFYKARFIWILYSTHLTFLEQTVRQLNATTKLTKWYVRPAKTQISLGICPVWSESFCLHEETLGSYLPIERTAKILIRLGRCPGWSKSSLGAHSVWWFCHVVAHVMTTTLTSLIYFRNVIKSDFIGTSSCVKSTDHMARQWNLRWACASRQSRQSLCCLQAQNMELEEASKDELEIWAQWMAAHAGLKDHLP